MKTETTGRDRAATTDLLIVGGLACVAFLVASSVELHELFSRSVADLERWQVDELPATLLVLAVGLAWFAWRRWREGVRQLAARLRAETKVRGLLEQNRQLVRRQLALREDERRALARDLHDDFGQEVHLVRVEAAYLGNLGGLRDPEADAAVKRIREAGEDLNRLLREMLKGLRPVLLDTMGLAPALEDLCEGWAEKSGIPCLFEARGLPCDLDDRLSGAAAIALYRATQEALLNVMKHSGAHVARVQLAVEADSGEVLGLEIADDGRGLADSRPGDRLGLLGMDERIVAVGASISVDSRSGEGVRIRIRLPLSARHA